MKHPDVRQSLIELVRLYVAVVYKTEARTVYLKYTWFTEKKFYFSEIIYFARILKVFKFTDFFEDLLNGKCNRLWIERKNMNNKV